MKQAKLDKRRKHQRACTVSYNNLFDQYLDKNDIEKYTPYKNVSGYRWKNTGECATVAMILMSCEFDLLYPVLRSKAYK